MAINATMRAVAWLGIPFNMTVIDVPRPTIQHENDVIVRITHSAICGTDLHTYRGTQGGTAQVPWTMGHEGIGYITEAGEAVTTYSVGDYVVIPDQADDGRLNLESIDLSSVTFGFGNDLGGTQGMTPARYYCDIPTNIGPPAEYVRVPFADYTLLPTLLTRNTTNATAEINYLFLSDIFATAWGGIDFSGFQAGDTVAVFGAGPVGMLAAYSAATRGASRVYIVDYVQDRLDRAASVGAIPINFRASDPVEQILAHEPNGVDRVVDCVGYEAVNSELQPAEDIVLRQAVAVAAQGGGIGVVGAYVATGVNTTAAPRGATLSPTVPFDITDFFGKGLSMRSGGVNPQSLAPQLLPLVESGTVDLNFIVSNVIGIEDAPEYYARFNRHEESKVIIEFPL